MEYIDKVILNPSFIIPVLYSSIMLNIILILILARVIGPLRKVLNTFYVVNPSELVELKQPKKDNSESGFKTQENKINQDKQQINTQELF